MKHLFAALVSALALLAMPVMAAPQLRPSVEVAGAVVTIGDMFADAGALASTPLFRAPAPGTTGRVDLAAIRSAATRAGLAAYDTAGLEAVAVTRSATHVDSALLGSLVATALLNRGLIPDMATPETSFDTPVSLDAELADEPVRILDLRYQPGGKAFSARFQVAGFERPLDFTGRIDLFADVPHLATTLPAGSILAPADVELKRIPLEYTDRTGIATLDQVVGKALKRNARAGLLLKTTDIEEPMVIRRNSPVTVVYSVGTMTLTVQAQALADASIGTSVQVMNSITHKLLIGIAQADGTVAIGTLPRQVAGL